MKRTSVAVLMASLLFFVNSTFAESPPSWDRNLIVTEGSAEVTGQNDSARISIAVVTEGENLEKISSENAGKTRAVIKAIKGLKVDDIKIKTSNFRVTPKKDYKARPPRIKGYEVHNGIEVALEGFDPQKLSKHVSEIVARSLKSGANNIRNIQLYIKNKEPLEKEALTRATKEAMERARTLARAAGVKLKRIASLSTHPMHIPPVRHMFREAGMKSQAAESPPIEAGESLVRVKVNLAYEIE